MDLFFQKRLQHSLLSLTSDEIKRIAFDRITLLNICTQIIKTVRKNVIPFSKEFRAILKYELIRTNKTQLEYLIGEDDQLEFSDEHCAKIYLSWFTLMSVSVLVPKFKKLIKTQEANLIAVFMSRLNRRLQDTSIQLAVRLKFFEYASAAEVHTNKLDPSKKYVKIHYTKITYSLSKESGYFNIMRNGYYYIDFKQNLGNLFLYAIEQEWERNWNEYFSKRNELINMYKKEETIRRIEQALAQKEREPMVVVQNFHELPTTTTSSISPEMAQKFFPPCMTSMLASFMYHGELKHDARKQLTLFLKDIGVPKNKIIELYDSNYSRPSLLAKKMEVLYFMRHLIGMTHTKKDYNSYNCKQIQDYTANDGRVHGCYFKKTPISEMELDMRRLNFLPLKRQAIFKTLQNKGFTAACRLHLQIRFNLKDIPYEMDKPNAYYYAAKCSNPCKRVIDIEDFITPEDDVIFNNLIHQIECGTLDKNLLDEVKVPTKKFKR